MPEAPTNVGEADRQPLVEGEPCDTNGACKSRCCSGLHNVCLANSTLGANATSSPESCLVDSTTLPPTTTKTFHTLAQDLPRNATFYIGVGVGVVVGIAILVLFVWRTSRPDPIENDRPRTRHAKPPVAAAALVLSDADKACLEAFRLDGSKLELDLHLATGGYGTVWRGTYNGDVVAVKMLFEDRKSAAGVSKFIAEVGLMAKLGSPYIVSFIGATWTTLEALALVVEYMNLGDLSDFLRQHTPGEFAWPAKRQCAMDVLQGLIYLHDQKIIHRDIKSRNVLLDTAKPSKLSDFGVSREVSSKTMSQEVGTYLWTAPEILRGDRYTVAADVYSFGVLLGEFDSHQPPYHGVTTTDGGPMLGVSIMMKVMQNQLQVQVSASCPRRIASLVKMCTQNDAKTRPTASEVLQSLLVWAVDEDVGNSI
ncbi:TKL protein kinase, variant [Aphanomyces astaci]|uniref:TKL protein kinase, variant n=1 Tax=Aphanomyces astaci TaxID=112090 RepID=W4FML0_APHAT|nr:TKL protein kinase, variant [Aphanomyces astaci]ETV67933.1 TKL protein kinase, variant [Aphanomyces astaci]|eukprot:XP_009842495.1 TKL protein kinase, variant [Aphanomyces astaci]